MIQNSNETVEMLARSHGYFPTSFRWRGRRFDVVAVERCWSEKRPAQRRVFRVRCQAGSFVLEQAVASNRWRVRRAPLTLWLAPARPSAPPRFPLPRRQRRSRAGQGLLARVTRQLTASRRSTAQVERKAPWTPTPQRT